MMSLMYDVMDGVDDLAYCQCFPPITAEELCILQHKIKDILLILMSALMTQKKGQLEGRNSRADDRSHEKDIVNN